MSVIFHELEVGYVRRELDSTVEIGFSIPEQKKAAYAFSPGQYLTIKVQIGDQLLRRAYSICSAVNLNTISLLVKRLKGGRVSNYLNDKIMPGDRFQVMVPKGEFKISLDEDNSAGTYFLFAAGSGITPMMSMIQSLLSNDTDSVCHLLYGNRNEESIIFKALLERLQLVYQDRLTVTYTLSRPIKKKAAGWLGIMKSPQSTWTGITGRINEKIILQFLEKYKGQNIKGYYICGPGPMIETTVDTLNEAGLDRKKIHREYFTSADLKTDTEDVIVDTNIPPKAAIITQDGVLTKVLINGKTNIVQAMANKGMDPPYSCLSGTCSTCKAKLIKGKINMAIDIGLEDGEEEEGYILTCQSHLVSDEVELTFDIN